MPYIDLSNFGNLDNVSHTNNIANMLNNTMGNININWTNSTNSTMFKRDEELAEIEIIVQSVILVLAVLGNTTVLIALFLRRRNLTRMHVLMIHLSLADLFVAFCSLLPQLAWDVTYIFQGGDFLCRLVKYMQIVAIYASSYVLLVTAIDRYVAICHPFLSHKWPTNMVHKLVSVAWFLSLLFSVPQIFFFSKQLNSHGVSDCWVYFDPPWVLTMYVTTFTCLVWIIPTLILIFCYSSICLTVWKSSKASALKGTSEIRNKRFISNGDDVDNDGSPLGTNKTKLLRSKIRKGINVIRASRQTHQTCLDTHHGTGFANEKTYVGSIVPGNASNTSKDKKYSQMPARRPHHDPGITRAKIKTIKLTMIVVICYLLCWSPFFVTQMRALYDETATFNNAVFTILMLLASLNSCANPWIYLIFSDTFVTCVTTICKSR